MSNERNEQKVSKKFSVVVVAVVVVRRSRGDTNRIPSLPKLQVIPNNFFLLAWPWGTHGQQELACQNCAAPCLCGHTDNQSRLAGIVLRL